MAGIDDPDGARDDGAVDTIAAAVPPSAVLEPGQETGNDPGPPDAETGGPAVSPVRTRLILCEDGQLRPVEPVTADPPGDAPIAPTADAAVPDLPIFRAPDDAAAAPVRRRGFLPIAALSTLVLVGVVLKIGIEPIAAAVHGLVQVARDGLPKPPERKVVEEVPRALPSDALAGLPRELSAMLTEPQFQAGQEFSYLLGLPPSDICAAMAKAGLGNPGWQEEAEGGSGFQCLSDLVPVPGSTPKPPPRDPDAEAAADESIAAPPAAPSTVFFMARGRSADQINVIRFKLNLDDPAVDRSGRALLLGHLEALSGPLAWSVPEAVADAILRHHRLLLRDRGVTVQVHPETGPVKRVNVTLLLTDPGARLPTDRFVDAPAVPDALVTATEPAAGAAAAGGPAGLPTAGAARVPPAGAEPTPGETTDASSREAPIEQLVETGGDEPPAAPPRPPTRPPDPDGGAAGGEPVGESGSAAAATEGADAARP